MPVIGSISGGQAFRRARHANVRPKGITPRCFTISIIGLVFVLVLTVMCALYVVLQQGQNRGGGFTGGAPVAPEVVTESRSRNEPVAHRQLRRSQDHHYVALQKLKLFMLLKILRIPSVGDASFCPREWENGTRGFGRTGVHRILFLTVRIIVMVGAIS